jgi:hypothetical protein
VAQSDLTVFADASFHLDAMTLIANKPESAPSKRALFVAGIIRASRARIKCVSPSSDGHDTSFESSSLHVSHSRRARFRIHRNSMMAFAACHSHERGNPEAPNVASLWIKKVRR